MSSLSVPVELIAATYQVSPKTFTLSFNQAMDTTVAGNAADWLIEGTDTAEMPVEAAPFWSGNQLILPNLAALSNYEDWVLSYDPIGPRIRSVSGTTLSNFVERPVLEG